MFAVKLLGPLQVKLAPDEDELANKLIDPPAHKLFVAALAVGAVGAPGLIIE